MFKRSKKEEHVLERARVLRDNINVHLKCPWEKKAIFARSPLSRGVELWRELDHTVQRLVTLEDFVKAIK